MALSDGILNGSKSIIGKAVPLNTIIKTAAKIINKGFCAIWVSTQSAIAKASCLLYAKIKALYDTIPLVLGDYTSSTKTASKIAYENELFYFHGGANILYKSANIDLSESSAQITLENAIIETFSLGQNLNIIAYFNTNDFTYNINVYNKQWEFITSLLLTEAPASTTKIKIVNNDFIIFNESKAYSISDLEQEDIEDYAISVIYSGGDANNQIQDIDYFNGEYYWSAKIYRYNGFDWGFVLYKGIAGARIQIKTIHGYSDSAGLAVNANGLVWYSTQGGVIYFSSDGTNWVEKYISDTPDLDFDASEPNNFFAVGIDSDGNFVAYNKAYIVNLTATPTTPAEWTFEKTGLAQAEAIPVNDIVFTEKGNAYFVDGKYIYAPRIKPTYTKTFKIGSEILAGIGESTGITSATVNKTTYEGIIPDTDGRTFTFDGTDWYLGEDIVDLTDYGITYEGTATTDDEIIISYYQAVITYYKLADGSAVCMPDQQTDLNKVFSEYGIVDFFVLDTENETIRPIRNNTDGYLYLYIGGNYVEETTEETPL